MNCSVIEIKSTAIDSLTTELAYYVASCRALGEEFIKLIPAVGTAAARSNTVRVIKNMQKAGRIALYIFEGEYFGTSREAEYLKNKHPQLGEVCTEGGQGILIKL